MVPTLGVYDPILLRPLMPDARTLLATKNR
jgi:hypothetical protein